MIAVNVIEGAESLDMGEFSLDDVLLDRQKPSSMPEGTHYISRPGSNLLIPFNAAAKRLYGENWRFVDMSEVQRIEDYLVKNRVVSLEELRELKKDIPFLSEDQFKMLGVEEGERIRYWSVTYSKLGLNPGILKGIYSLLYEIRSRNPEKEQRYKQNVGVWPAVNASLYFDKHGKLPDAEEKLRAWEVLTSRFRVAWMLEEEALGHKLDYGEWGRDKVIWEYNQSQKERAEMIKLEDRMRSEEALKGTF